MKNSDSILSNTGNQDKANPMKQDQSGKPTTTSSAASASASTTTTSTTTNRHVKPSPRLPDQNEEMQNRMDPRRGGVKDSEAHYDIDGVSLSNDDVVVSGDNQTTEGAPPPQRPYKDRGPSTTTKRPNPA